MKKIIASIVIIGCFVTLALGVVIDGFAPFDIDSNRVNPGALHTHQDAWYTAGTFTTGVTTPNATNRTGALFSVTDPKNVSYTIKRGWNGVRLRLSSTTDGDSTVIDVFLKQDASSTTTDHWNRVATLTWTTGQQTATTTNHEYADTLVESNANWHKTTSVMSPGGNYIAEWGIDVLGSGAIGFSATTVTNTAVLEITGF